MASIRMRETAGGSPVGSARPFYQAPNEQRRRRGPKILMSDDTNTPPSAEETIANQVNRIVGKAEVEAREMIGDARYEEILESARRVEEAQLANSLANAQALVSMARSREAIAGLLTSVSLLVLSGAVCSVALVVKYIAAG